MPNRDDSGDDSVLDELLAALPCLVGNPNLWFADNPADLELAKALCAECPIRTQCLAAALDRREPWGVWGGQIIEQGVVIARKRPQGRPRKNGEPQAVQPTQRRRQQAAKPQPVTFAQLSQ